MQHVPPAVWSVLLVGMACTGEIGEGTDLVDPEGAAAGPYTPGTPRAPGSTAAPPGSATPPGAPGAAAAGPTAVGASSALRLLTREEYDHTVRDLLGDTTRPGRELSPD